MHTTELAKEQYPLSLDVPEDCKKPECTGFKGGPAVDVVNAHDPKKDVDGEDCQIPSCDEGTHIFEFNENQKPEDENLSSSKTKKYRCDPVEWGIKNKLGTGTPLKSHINIVDDFNPPASGENKGSLCHQCIGGEEQEKVLNSWLSPDEAGISVGIPTSLWNRAKDHLSVIPGMKHIKSIDGNATGRVEDCCNDREGITEKGKGETAISVDIAAFELCAYVYPRWQPGCSEADSPASKIRETEELFTDWNGDVYNIEVIIEGGVFIKGEAKIELKGGRKWNDCEGSDCYFGSAALTGTPSFRVQAIIYGCILIGTNSGDSDNCAGITAKLAASMTFKFDVKYNDPCGSGWVGEPDRGPLVVKGSLMVQLGSLKPTASVQWEFLP